jgi:hypothetical protein
MLAGLLDFGLYLQRTGGDEDAGFLKPKDGKDVMYIEIAEDNIKHKLVLATPATILELQLYYLGSNGALTGAAGIGGASPFFLKTNLLDGDPARFSEKVSRSNGLLDYTEAEADKEFVTRYLALLTDHLPALRAASFKMERKFSKKEGKEVEKVVPVAEYFLVTHVLGKETGTLHAKFIDHARKKGRRKDTEDLEGWCSMCGRTSQIAEPGFKFFANVKQIFKKGFVKGSLEASRFKICEACNTVAVKGWEKLTELFGSGYILIPRVVSTDEKTRDEFYRLFVKTVNESRSSLESLLLVLGESALHEQATFTFVVYKKGKSTAIKQHVDNIKLHLYRFENLQLVIGEAVCYMPAESFTWYGTAPREVKTFFDIERCLQCFFVEQHEFNKRCTNKKFSRPFFTLYTQDLPDSMPSAFRHLLRVHEEALTTFIYHAKPETLDIAVLDEICMNFLDFQIGHIKKENKGVIETDIITVLNVYYFIKHKVLREPMLKQAIDKLKADFGRLIVIKENRKVVDQATADRIKEVVSTGGHELLFYILGNFCKRLDAMRYRKDKKNPIFEGFVRSVNRKDFTRRFQEDVLQKQLHYINKMALRTKFAFDILGSFLDELQQLAGYDKAMIAMITGYYGTNLLQVTPEEEQEEDTDGKESS